MSQDLLKNIYLFKSLDAKELALVQEIASRDVLNGGDTVFNQGSEAKALYVIAFGSVSITKDKEGDQITVAKLATGSHFGEMAFIDGAKRSANAEATERTELVRIDYDKLRALLQKNTTLAAKFYQALCQFMCGRLRQTTEDLSFAREKNLRHF